MLKVSMFIILLNDVFYLRIKILNAQFLAKYGYQFEVCWVLQAFCRMNWWLVFNNLVIVMDTFKTNSFIPTNFVIKEVM